MSEPVKPLIFPDLWQQEAVRHLKTGCDVVINAPTGAGKTYVFEAFLAERGGISGQAVFTVPTRALANDKYLEWKRAGWRVGLTTGDLVIEPDAPVLVATLETQKRRLLEGHGPALLVIDEYQMLMDPIRGANYEIALACAPADTRLLLLSGSVGNPASVVRWLEGNGRQVALVEHTERPVPLDDVDLTALPGKAPPHIRGRLNQLLAKALLADLGPILVFTPRRRNAEQLARDFAAQLQAPDFLSLAPEQAALAGRPLAKLLRHRVAYHHSGLSYAQRVGLVEPLAKAGQLKVVFATTGLAAGINFSVRSVLVLERRYWSGEEPRELRPDELLQMFGRAGRRGIDTRGSVLHFEGKARASEARPVQLKRAGPVDWTSLLTLLDQTVSNPASSETPANLDALTRRLFDPNRLSLGLDALVNPPSQPSKQPPAVTPPSPAPSPQPQPTSVQSVAGGTILEIRNSQGLWERRRPPRPARLGSALYWHGDSWQPALQVPQCLAAFKYGVNCRLPPAAPEKSNRPRYGKDVPLAAFPTESGDNRLRLTKWLRSTLPHVLPATNGRKPNHRPPARWKLERIESTIVPLLGPMTGGGQVLSLFERGNTLYARIDLTKAELMAYVDREGTPLLNPPTRRRIIEGNEETAPSSPATQHQHPPRPQAPAASPPPGDSIASWWLRLGLIDTRGHPTRRGRIAAAFNHCGEGMAVAAALEEPAYAIENLLDDLAELRAGRRFSLLGLAGSPIAALCSNTYRSLNVPGYLTHGLPIDFGEGVAELLRDPSALQKLRQQFPEAAISDGDLERARTEWRSLRCQIAAAPEFPWSRWTALQQAARASLQRDRTTLLPDDLPPLTSAQRKRHLCLNWV